MAIHFPPQPGTLFRRLTAVFNGNPQPPSRDNPPRDANVANRIRGGHEDRPPVVLKWIRLDGFCPQSPRYRLLLASLLDNEKDRRATTHLEGDDAFVVLEILAKALDRSRNLGTLSSRILRVARSLAFNACQIPTSYMINRNLKFTIDPIPFASGGFSDVRKGSLGGKAVAVKVLRISRATDVTEVQKHFCKEAVLWKNISHPNILALIAAEIDSKSGKCCMISELMENGNIYQYIQHNSVSRLRLLVDIADGLHYLHDRNIIHGDIKGHNVLITSDSPPRACLSDFGFSAPVPTVSISTRGMNPGGGTPPFMAPELIYPSRFGLPSPQVSREADIYAFGMVIYEVVTGVRPFNAEGYGYEELLFVVLEGKRPAKPANADEIGFENGTWELVEQCWSQDRLQRPSTWDVRMRITLAAQMSPAPAPPGPRVPVVPRPSAANAETEASAHFEKIFENGHDEVSRAGPEDQAEAPEDDRADPGEADPGEAEPGDDHSGYLEYLRQATLENPVFENSVATARQVVNEINETISPTVQQGVEAVVQRLPGLLANLRGGFGLWSPRNSPQV